MWKTGSPTTMCVRGGWRPPEAWHDRLMPGPAALLPCRRCHRPVGVSHDQHGVFEDMHYVCFHYEFEHDPVDPDEECGAGGCPSAAVSLRPGRRPGLEPAGRDQVLGSGWIWLANVRRFFELAGSYVSYGFDDSDWLAVDAGIEALQDEAGVFSYPVAGRQVLTVSLGRDPGGDEVTVRITGRPDRLLGARLGALMDAFSL